MGSDEDDLAVVDANFAVRGCGKLYVCDTSVMPLPLAANPMATAYMVGELFSGRLLK